MSSLAATQADGYYLPVAYFDSGAYKKQSKNQWNAAATQSQRGSAGVTSQERKQVGHTNQSERHSAIVRFELPYDGICDSCHFHIKRGTRFNARKSTVGAYHSTPIYEFQLKCRSCSHQTFVIQTNPAAFGFDYVSGIRKQVRDFAAESDDGCLTKDEQVRSRTRTAPEFLEQRNDRRHRERTELEELQQLETLQRRQFNDADHNSHIRSQFRVDRRKRHRQLAQGAALGWGHGLALLEDGTIDEEVISKTTIFGPDGRTKERDEFRKLQAASIFSSPTNSSRKRKMRSGSRSLSGTHSSEDQPDAVVSHPQGSQCRLRRRHAVAETIDLTGTAAELEQQHLLVERPLPKPRKRRIVPCVTRDKGVRLATLPSHGEDCVVSAHSRDNAPAAGALEALANYDSSSGEEN